VKLEKKQFGRSMRHKDVRRCSVGAFGFYLLFRFHKSGEMADCRRPNFGKNKEWYDIKILTDGTRNEMTKEIQKRTYTDPIRKVFRKLSIVTAHFGHWGRVNAPAELEFEEVSPEYIRILGEWGDRFRLIVVFTFSLFYFSLHTGNWDPKTQESRYSSKMPTPALRVIAGYEQGERYFLPRSRVEPPESLQKMIFPFIEGELENVSAAVEDDGKERPTAMCTLRLWLKLRIIILQDAAEIWVRFPSRKGHSLFRLPVFRSPEFHVSFFCCLLVG
jgi:hypothetical protein